MSKLASAMMRVIRVAFAIWGFFWFIVLMLLLMPAFFLASFFGKVRGGNMIYRICGFWADLWFPLIGLRPRLMHESLATETRPCIFVANHSSYMDIPMIVYTVREKIRPLGKSEMAKIPLFGFLYRHATIMVDRSSPANRAKSVHQLKSMLQQGVSIFIFPEGTFEENQTGLQPFYDGAFRIAIETQTPIQPIIFPDSAKRLSPHSVFSLAPGISRVVYLPAVTVEGLHKEDISALKASVHQLMDEALKKYRIAEQH